jgi:WD40 repeat protein
LRSWLYILALGVFASAPARAETSQQLLYLATWPHQILVFDTVSEKVVDHIDLNTDVAQLLALSADKKKLYASTVNDNSVVTIDLATRKVTSSFSLNTPGHNVRLLSLTPDNSGKTLYGIAITVNKLIDRYEIETPKFIVVDLDSRKITRTVDFPKDESLVGFWQIQAKFSPDSKYFYLFLGNVLVFDANTFQLVRKLDLADPHVPGINNVIFNQVEEYSAEDPNEEPGKLTNVFMASDPYVHRAVFGIAKIDLSNLSFDFRPVAPAVTLSMTPLLLTPDHQTGYTVAIDGSTGYRTCEFWAFDMKTRKLINKKEFAGRNRFSFALSADGTKIFIYGAGPDVEVFDAKTFDSRSHLLLPGDLTSNIIVMPLSPASASSAPSVSASPSP